MRGAILWQSGLPGGRLSGMGGRGLSSALSLLSLMRCSLAALSLLSFALLSGICAGSYARASVSASSTREALPFALPFMLFSTASASALLLSGVAAVDAGARKRR